MSEQSDSRDSGTQPTDTQATDTDQLRNYRNYSGFRRSTTDRKVAGVAGGLGQHLNIDPVIIRVALVVLCCFGGAGFLLYAIAWLLVPNDTGAPATVQLSDSNRNIALIVVAAVAVLLVLGDSWAGFGPPWWLAIAGLVVFALLMNRENRSSHTTTEATAVLPEPDPAPATYVWQPVAPAPGPVLVPVKKKGPLLFGITLALIAVGLGILGLVDAGGQNVSDAAYPALALAIIGGMLVVGSFFGRPGGLVLLGLVTSVVVLGTGIAEPRYDGDRDLVVRPTSITELESSYSIPAGRLVLDLTDLSEPGALIGKDIELDMNAGEIQVLLPEGIGANVAAEIGFAGAIDLPDDSRGGFGPSITTSIGDTGSDDAHINLSIDLGVGHIEVKEAA